MKFQVGKHQVEMVRSGGPTSRSLMLTWKLANLLADEVEMGNVRLSERSSMLNKKAELIDMFGGLPLVE